MQSPVLDSRVPPSSPLHRVPFRRHCSKSVLCKLSHSMRKPLRVMVLGLAGVGKSALTVRFITRRFIGDYDPTLEDIYTYESVVNTDIVCFQILDSGGHSRETEHIYLEANIRWAEAFILMYSVTDKCSFDECIRLKFFINLYHKRRRTLGGPLFRDIFDVPVVLVGNKADQYCERMISLPEGERRSQEIGCVSFHEISVRESVEDVQKVFEDVYFRWKTWNNAFKHRRSANDADMSRAAIVTPHSLFKPALAAMAQRAPSACSLRIPSALSTSSSPESSKDPTAPDAFRDRASTDGSLQTAAKWRCRKVNARYALGISSPLRNRRMSISMRGSSST